MQNVPGITLFLRNTKKKAKSLKLHFLQNIPFLNFWHRIQKCWKHPWKAFSESLLSNSVVFLMTSVATQKPPSIIVVYISKEQVKSREVMSAEYGGNSWVVTLFFVSINYNRLVCWSIVIKEKPIVSSLFFGAISYDRVSKTTKGVSVHFFILCINLYKLYQRIPVNYIRKFR